MNDKFKHDWPISPVQAWQDASLKLSSFAANLLFLERCRICRARKPWVNEPSEADGFESRAVCRICWAQLKQRHLPAVDWCKLSEGNAFMVGSGTVYDGALKKLIYHLKYDGDRLIACDLAYFLAAGWQQISGAVLDAPLIPVLVPVPLHRDRLRSRGYNQAELVALQAAKRLGLAVDAKVLKRLKPTVPQHGLGRLGRLANLRHAFACDQARLPGRTIILVDDVFTSGATLAEAARTVLSGGAARVFGLTVSRAGLKGLNYPDTSHSQ